MEAQPGAIEAHPGVCRLTLELGGSLWSLESHFGWRLIQELLGHEVLELTIDNGVLCIDHGARPKIMEAHTGVI
jgi:hypothetical protein